MRKKTGCKKSLVLTVLLSFAFLALAGCSGGGSEKKEPDGIKIGANLEMTGTVANYGDMVLKGVQLAFKEANEQGGVLGKKLTLIVADNKSEPAEAAGATTKLITKDKVVAIIGSGISSTTLASVPINEEYKIPIITPSGTNAKITVDNGKVRPYSFRVGVIDPFQGTIMANFAANILKAKTAVIYVDSSSDYSKGLAKTFEEVFGKNGGKILSTEAFLQKDQDFKSALTKIKGLNPDVVFLPVYYEEVGRILKQGRELGLNMPFLGGDAWDDPKIIEIAGVSALNNGFFLNHYSPLNPDKIVQDFIMNFKKEYGKEPNALSAMGYDAALMVIDSIKRAGSAEPEKIRQAMAQIKNLEGTTGTINIDENHDPVKSIVIVEYKDGKQVFKEKITP